MSFLYLSGRGGLGFCEELNLSGLPSVLPASGPINFQELSGLLLALQESPRWISNIKGLVTVKDDCPS